MKKCFFLLVLSLFSSMFASDLPEQGPDWIKAPEREWYIHYDKAVEAARKSNKLIYVFRTGSDWCGFCVKLKREVLGGSKFKRLQKKHFIFLYLDFPRRTTLPDTQKRHNSEVCRMNGLNGGFPTAKLITPDGEEVGKIVGYRPEARYIKELEAIIRKKPAVKAPQPSAAEADYDRTNVQRSRQERNNPPASAKGGTLPPQDKGTYMSVLSMGTSRNGEGLIFPQELQVETGEYIYFRIQCKLPPGRSAKILIVPPFGSSKVQSSRLGKDDCELTVGLTFTEPFEFKELELRLIPIDSNTPLETRFIPVKINWCNRRQAE
jgi:protein disulfide-isomerase